MNERVFMNDIPVLEAQGLECTYKSGSRVVKGLDHVSLKLMPGSILGVVGESGSGKSSLIRHLACLEQAQSGKLFLHGKEYTGSSPAFAGQFMQMIFQDALSSFDPKMRLERSIREGRKRPDDPALLKSLLKDVSLDEGFLTRYPGSLSGGQCQRMSIVRAVYSGAGILLCDEVTSALDAVSQSMIIGLLGSIRDRYGVSMIFVSHDLGAVSRLCDRVMVMKQGKVVEEGETSDVIRRPQHAYTKELLDAVIEMGQ